MIKNRQISKFCQATYFDKIDFEGRYGPLQYKEGESWTSKYLRKNKTIGDTFLGTSYHNKKETETVTFSAEYLAEYDNRYESEETYLAVDLTDYAHSEELRTWVDNFSPDMLPNKVQELFKEAMTHFHATAYLCSDGVHDAKLPTHFGNHAVASTFCRFSDQEQTDIDVGNEQNRVNPRHCPLQLDRIQLATTGALDIYDFKVPSYARRKNADNNQEFSLPNCGYHFRELGNTGLGWVRLLNMLQLKVRDVTARMVSEIQVNAPHALVMDSSAYLVIKSLEMYLISKYLFSIFDQNIGFLIKIN